MFWLLTTDMMRQFRAFKAVDLSQHQSGFEAYHCNIKSSDNNPILSVVGEEAIISVRGVLTVSSCIMSWFFNEPNTTYSGIEDALKRAESDNNVKKIILNIDSPGGQTTGLFALTDFMQSISKPMECHVEQICASAAYAIASQCQSITAKHKSCFIGSIGVAQILYHEEDKIEITSTEAPDKRPDVTTEEGKAVYREALDDIHDLFVGSIAQGRNTTENNINKNYGRGKALIAEKALKAGMIDHVSSSVAQGKNPPKSSNIKEAKMDLETFMAQHKDLYNQVLSLGVSQERDRVVAHLTMGKSSGDMDLATKSIEDGKEITATIQSQYFASAMNKKDIVARIEDGGIVDTGTPKQDIAASEEDKLIEAMIAGKGA